MDIRVDRDVPPYLSLVAALSYGIASMAMVFINKAVLMQYAHSMTLLTLQQLATALLIHLGRVMGSTKSSALNMDTAKKLMPVSLFYNGNVAFALASLKGVNIPMYIAIKRLTPLAVLIAGFFYGKGRPSKQVSDAFARVEIRLVIKNVSSKNPLTFCSYGSALCFYFLGRDVSYMKCMHLNYKPDISFVVAKLASLWWHTFNYYQVTLSVSLTAAGVIIAALGDFSFDFFGYSMALTSVFFQTMYLVLVERSGAEDGLSSVEIMFYNSFLSLPFLLFLIIVTGEFPGSLSLLFAKSNFSFLVILLLSLVMGIVLNYTMFLCTIVNSALTTTIVGVLKGVGSTTLGFILLGGVQVHALNVTGLVINTAGGLWYSYAKYQQKKSKQPNLISDVEAHRK